MSFVKNIATALAFYCFALIQSSFLIHFNIYGFVPNLILISVFVLNLIESPEKKSGLFFAAFGGFLVDVFSNRLIGLNLSLYLILAFIIKYLLRNYVRVSFGKNI
ncbi:MAG: rod shape-determining protein MreD [Candidatus Nealsonbacteria bacterium]|nr:rod shape-determining protein MreD [Candidatus Nealsonbacteria bacterium]